jgi:hypothetical protein
VQCNLKEGSTGMCVHRYVCVQSERGQHRYVCAMRFERGQHRYVCVRSEKCTCVCLALILKHLIYNTRAIKYLEGAAERT